MTRIGVAVVGVASSLAALASLTPAAHAGVLSLATGPCGQTESQAFSQFGDSAWYVTVPGGSFEAGTPSWHLSGGAAVVSGNESYNVAGGSHSLSLPAGGSATSPQVCTGIDHPSARLFVRNTGATASRLNVWATYPLLLGIPYTAYLGQLSTSSSRWRPSNPVVLGLLNNTLGSLTLAESTVSFTFAPADMSGHWQIDDVYLDPYHRS